MSLLPSLRPNGSHLWPLGLLWLGLAQPAGPALAFEGLSPSSAPGSWDISEADGPRKCRIMLRTPTGAAAPGPVGMPAGCRKAFPVLGEAGAWTISDDHRLTLEDRSGRVLLAFAPGEEERLVGTGPDGETYALEQVGRPRTAVVTPVTLTEAAAGPVDPGLSPIKPLPRRTQVAAANGTPVAAQGGSAAADPMPPVVPYGNRMEAIAGRYGILREGDRDMGCLLTLDMSARGPGGHKAQLAPACRDQGIVVFDPVGWRFERGHLILRARKGHDVQLQYHADGVWRKDPKDGGKPLGLKKI